MTAFILGELHQLVEDEFSILLTAADVVRFFGGNLKLSWIAEVTQRHRRSKLIMNLYAQPNEGMANVNATKFKEIAPESIQFGRALPHILQEIWEAYPFQRPV